MDRAEVWACLHSCSGVDGFVKEEVQDGILGGPEPLRGGSGNQKWTTQVFDM